MRSAAIESLTKLLERAHQSGERGEAALRLVLRSLLHAAREAHLGLANVELEGFSWLSGEVLDPVLVDPAVRALGLALGTKLEVAHALGTALDLLRAAEARIGQGTRKKTGSYFTPPEVARAVVSRALPHVPPQGSIVVCDPAVGGGAFLLEAAAALLERDPSFCLSDLIGIDTSRLALEVAEVSLLLAFGVERGRPRMLLGDSTGEKPPEPGRVVQWVLGNPPWVAYQGRATVPLSPEVRASYRRRFRAFSGYPTLQGIFVERATELGPQALISLLVPSSLADLDGYGSARQVLTETHQVEEPLLEFGGDAFDGVVQPCFALIATPRKLRGRGEPGPFRLEERARYAGESHALEVPKILSEIARLPCLPAEAFGEWGFQSNRQVSEGLLKRGAVRNPEAVPLWEGRHVSGFWEGPADCYLVASSSELKAARVHLRSAQQFRLARFVVRQTASFTIAALHGGGAFRNSLLGGFAVPEYSPEVLVGLLNSWLYRALFVAAARDVRQAVFPQVKIGRLRSLPSPPERSGMADRLSDLVGRLHSPEPDASLYAQLNELVFDWFGVSEFEREQIRQFLQERAPTALMAAGRGMRSRTSRGKQES